MRHTRRALVSSHQARSDAVRQQIKQQAKQQPGWRTRGDEEGCSRLLVAEAHATAARDDAAYPRRQQKRLRKLAALPGAARCGWVRADALDILDLS